MQPAQLTLGTMNFGGRTDTAEALRIVDLALERGVQWVDTANSYGNGQAERIVGQALRGRRSRVKLATKVGLFRRGGAPEGLRRQQVLASLEESLQRLQVDAVDLYVLHAPDANTPIEETLDALAALLDAKKVLAWGVSNHASWQVLELIHAADARGMPRPMSSQVLYNALIRQLDLEYFAFAAKYDVQTNAYNPLAGGLLARPPTSIDTPPAGTRLATNSLYRQRYWSPALRALTATLHGIAQNAGLELFALAYAWLAGRADIDSIVLGPGQLAHLEAAFDACAKPLPDDVRRAVDAAHRASLGTDVSYAR